MQCRPPLLEANMIDMLAVMVNDAPLRWMRGTAKDMISALGLVWSQYIKDSDDDSSSEYVCVCA